MANSKIYLGSINIGSIFQGASDVSIYLGAEKVYPLGEPALKWLATYSDSHTESAQCGSSSEIVRNEINKTNLVNVEIGDCVTTIGVLAFDGYSSLTSITIPNSVTTIDRGGLSFTGLIDVVLPNSVTSIGKEAFMSCSALTSVTIPNSVTHIGDIAFENCTSLTSITVNASTPPTLGGYAFDATNNCPIYVPAESVDTYKAATNWSTYSSRIQAIPTPTDNWVLVESDFGSPRKVKVDYSLIEDDDSESRDDYQLNSYDSGIYSIMYLNQPTLEWMMEEGYGGDELAEYYQKVGLFNQTDGIIGILEDGVEYTSIGGVNLSDYTLFHVSSMPNYYLYATQ